MRLIYESPLNLDTINCTLLVKLLVTTVEKMDIIPEIVPNLELLFQKVVELIESVPLEEGIQKIAVLINQKIVRDIKKLLILLIDLRIQNPENHTEKMVIKVILVIKNELLTIEEKQDKCLLSHKVVTLQTVLKLLNIVQDLQDQILDKDMILLEKEEILKRINIINMTQDMDTLLNSIKKKF